MEYKILGRTGLPVSQIGLGAGGPSCLGLKQGNSEKQCADLVRRALDLGVNLFDTAGRNRTEGPIGQAIKDVPRESVVLSTKRNVSDNGVLVAPTQFANAIEDSFRALDTEYVDIMHFHGVRPKEYDYVVTELLPVLQRFQQEGYIRFIGITEIFDKDREHHMLQRALDDDFWDVVMVGFNMVNQGARKTIFPAAMQKRVAILDMFAVRRALISDESFKHAVQRLQALGQVDESLCTDAILKNLREQVGSQCSIANIAYRYCRDEAAIDSVLIGTGNQEHLEENVKTFADPPLPLETRNYIDSIFSRVIDFSGN